ncbi:zinc-binding dehydrogenase [Aerosakkonemataceae cyanobacterium BLCC-F50]|uniref:Zinc-binding dehydrogenase n=1 Tax=Floridaenema flaviceps BLCC-F50 TaxID=3153642 RepID=A0ABV4XWV1_9CYAN
MKHRRLINYGFSAALSAKKGRMFKLVTSLVILSALGLIPDRKKAIFYSISDYKKKYGDRFREDLGKLLELLKENKIKPKIGEIIPLIEAQRTHELLEKSAVMGKLVLICNQL